MTCEISARDVSPEVALFVDWAEQWVEAELRSGQSPEAVVDRFNQSAPIAVSIFNACVAARQAELQLAVITA